MLATVFRNMRKHMGAEASRKLRGSSAKKLHVFFCFLLFLFCLFNLFYFCLDNIYFIFVLHDHGRGSSQKLRGRVFLEGKICFVLLQRSNTSCVLVVHRTILRVPFLVGLQLFLVFPLSCAFPTS